MIKGMDHVGIAVENIDDMVSFFGSFVFKLKAWGLVVHSADGS